jgi:TonB family protein
MSFKKYLGVGVLCAVAALTLTAAPDLPRVHLNPESKMVRKVQPAYPQEAADLGVTGSVLIDVVVAKDGHVENLRLRSGHPLLAPAALQAVRQWIFQPFVVNGAPARVVTEVNVPFARPDPAQRKPENAPGSAF